MDCCCDPGFESCEVVVKGERDLFAKDLQSLEDMGITFLFSLYFVDGIEFECQSRTCYYDVNIKEHFLKRGAEKTKIFIFILTCHIR